MTHTSRRLSERELQMAVAPIANRIELLLGLGIQQIVAAGRSAPIEHQLEELIHWLGQVAPGHALHQTARSNSMPPTHLHQRPDHPPIHRHQRPAGPSQLLRRRARIHELT